MDVEPTIPFPPIPVPRVEPLPEYSRHGYESPAMFADRIRITTRYQHAQTLRRQAWRLLSTELAKRGKSAAQLESLRIVFERLEKNLASFGYAGDVRNVPPAPNEILEGVRIVNEMVGVSTREPTPEEAVDLFGSMLGEHVVRAGAYDELLQRNGPRDAQLGKRRGGGGMEQEEEEKRRRRQQQKRRPRRVSARPRRGRRAAEEEEEEDETIAQKMERERKQRAEKRRLAEATLRGKERQPPFERADLKRDLTDAETKELLNRMDQIEEVDTRVVRNALTKLMAPRGGRGAASSTSSSGESSRGSWRTLISVWWDRDTPLKRALVRRYSISTLVFFFLPAASYYLLHRLTDDGIDALVREMRESRADYERATRSLQDAAAGVGPAKLAYQQAENTLVRMQNAISAARLHLDESEELIRAEFGDIQGFVTTWGGDLRRVSEKLRVSLNDPHEADMLMSSYGTLNTMLESAVEKIVAKIHAGGDIQREEEEIITQMSVQIGLARRNLALLESRLKESVQNFTQLNSKLAELTGRVQQLPRRSLMLAGRLAELINALTARVFGSQRYDVGVAVEVMLAPLRALESMIFLTYARGAGAEARDMLFDLVWRSAQTAAGWWSAVHMTTLYQWLRGAVSTPFSIFQKQQRGEPLTPAEQLRQSASSMIQQAQGADDFAEQLGTARHFGSVAWALRLVPTGVMEFLPTAGYMFGALSSVVMFGLGLAGLYTATASVSVGVTYSLVAVSPLLMARYEIPGFGDMLRAWSHSDSALVSASARRLRVLLSPSGQVPVFASAINLLTSLSRGSSGIASYFAAEAGFLMLHAMLPWLFGTGPLELFFYLAQAEQLGMYARDAMHMIDTEKRCLESADFAYLEEKAKADSRGRETTEQEYLELQERVLHECRKASRRAYLEHPTASRFWDGIRLFMGTIASRQQEEEEEAEKED